MDLPSLTVGLIATVLVTWLVAHLYYRRQLRDQEQNYRRLQGDLGGLPDRIVSALMARNLIVREREPEARDVARNLIIRPMPITATADVGNPTVIIGPPRGQKTVTDVSGKQALRPEDTLPGSETRS